MLIAGTIINVKLLGMVVHACDTYLEIKMGTHRDS
jgi:hypothetical protein